MSDYLKAFATALVDHLRGNVPKFVYHNSWMGDSERGYYSQDTFEMDKLIAEIDKFTETFKPTKEQK